MDGILTIPERDALQERVASFINGNPASMTAIIPAYHLTKIATNSIPIQYAFNIVRYCEQLAWVENPSLILRLLEYWHQDPVFAGAHQRINAQEPPRFFPGNKPWDTVLLAVDLPFLNRSRTRRVIECFFYPLVATVSPPGIRVLVVKGDSKSGKTYTAQYIKYINVCYAQLAFKVIWVDLKKHFSNSFGPAELTEAILDQVNEDWRSFGISFPDQSGQQDARTTLQLAGIIAEQIAATSRTHILILDGFGEDPADTIGALPVSKALTELVQHLVTIATGAQLPLLSCDMMRLALLGFNQPVANYLNRVRVDDIQPLTETDVVQYFNNYLQVHPQPGISISVHDIQATAELVLKVVDTADPDRTKKISDIALAAIKKVIIKAKENHVGTN